MKDEDHVALSLAFVHSVHTVHSVHSIHFAQLEHNR